MQLIPNDQPKGFQPVNVTIRIETRQEANALDTALASLRLEHISKKFDQDTRHVWIDTLETIAKGIK
tara:strand:- start:238 stop:438 length:201 start_codon:yes stop_codon:yes gene_type:complete